LSGSNNRKLITKITAISTNTLTISPKLPSTGILSAGDICQQLIGQSYMIVNGTGTAKTGTAASAAPLAVYKSANDILTFQQVLKL